MKVSKCPLNIESCISCRYAEGTGLRCTYSIDKPEVEKPASEDIMADAINGAIEEAIYNFECAMADIRKRDSFSQKEDNLSFAEARNKVINQLMGALYPLYKKKHAGEVMGLLPELIKMTVSTENLWLDKSKIVGMYVSRDSKKLLHRIIMFDNSTLMLDGDNPYTTKEEAVKALNLLAEEIAENDIGEIKGNIHANPELAEGE